MRIDELFDKPPKAQALVSNAKKFLASTVIGDRKITFRAERYAQMWTVIFTEGDNGEAAMTGSGDEFKVMSFVVSCMQDLIAKHNPKAIGFSASATDDSRITIYRRMLKRLKGYTCEEKRDKYEVSYYLERNDLV